MSGGLTGPPGAAGWGMVATATERKLAWIVLAILVCVALIGFDQGLKSALAAPRSALPGETAAGIAAIGAAPREAGAPALLDEARVHEIAREEADAALVRAKPAPRKVHVAPVEDPAASSDDADTPPPPSVAPAPAQDAGPPAPPQG